MLINLIMKLCYNIWLYNGNFEQSFCSFFFFIFFYISIK